MGGYTRRIKNETCKKCGVVEKEMILVGVLVFCGRCFGEEFVSKDPVIEEREKYNYWYERVGGDKE